MRAVPPEKPDPGTSPCPEGAGSDLLVSLAVPFSGMKTKFCLRLLLEKQAVRGSMDKTGGGHGSLPDFLIGLSVFMTLLMFFAGGIFFFIYLIKSLAGIDLFRSIHLFS